MNGERLIYCGVLACSMVRMPDGLQQHVGGRANISFLRVGLSNADTSIPDPSRARTSADTTGAEGRSAPWPMRRFSTLLRELNHTGVRAPSPLLSSAFCYAVTAKYTYTRNVLVLVVVSSVKCSRRLQLAATQSLHCTRVLLLRVSGP